jgi:hypothetical protein
MANAREPYRVFRDLLDESLELLAKRREKYPGADLVAIRQLAGPAAEANAPRAQQVA